jgi:hypothetical protein
MHHRKLVYNRKNNQKINCNAYSHEGQGRGQLASANISLVLRKAPHIANWNVYTNFKPVAMLDLNLPSFANLSKCPKIGNGICTP